MFNAGVGMRKMTDIHTSSELALFFDGLWGVNLTNNANRDTIVTMGLKGSDINIARNDGVSSWPSIVALAESPKQAGVMPTNYQMHWQKQNISSSLV